uniref:Hepcidin n=1 Tax=Amphilophus citrinellus TaxID=61819 RepID=A0A3Q0QW96_AMPCI
MKTFTAAVVGAVVLVFICIQGYIAFPFTTVSELEEEMSNNNTAATQEETSVETWMMPFDIRENSHASPVRCRYCCGCCHLGGCGMCCQ